VRPGSLESWHLAPSGLRIEHAMGLYVSGERRRFVFRWHEEEHTEELVLDEFEGGMFHGVLATVGSLGGGEPVTARVDASVANEWRIEVARGGARMALTIHARRRG